MQIAEAENQAEGTREKLNALLQAKEQANEED